MINRYEVKKYSGRDFELFVIEDTKTGLPYRTCFSFETHAKQVCERLNAKYRKKMEQ